MPEPVASTPIEQYFEIKSYRFLGSGAGRTLKGFFTGSPTQDKPFDGGNAWQKGSPVTITIPQANGSNESVGFEDCVFSNTSTPQSTNGTIPADATGFVGVFSGATFVAMCGYDSELTANFEANAASLPWSLTMSDANGAIPFGRFNNGVSTLGWSSGSLSGSVSIVGTVTVTGTVDTELPAAALLADNTATPTVPAVGSFNMVYDGATWDFARGTAADGALVNLGTNNDVTVTGTVDITELPAAAALTDNFANPTTTQVAAMVMLWDGGNWDRAPGTSTDGATVNLGTNNDVVAAQRTDTIFESATAAVTPKFAIIDAASSGDNTLVAGVSSKKIRVLSLYLVAAGAVNVRFESGASGTALSGQMNLTTNSGIVLPYNPLGHFETAAAALLNMELSGAVSVDGGLTYIEVA